MIVIQVNLVSGKQFTISLKEDNSGNDLREAIRSAWNDDAGHTLVPNIHQIGLIIGDYAVINVDDYSLPMTCFIEKFHVPQSAEGVYHISATRQEYSRKAESIITKSLIPDMVATYFDFLTDEEQSNSLVICSAITAGGRFNRSEVEDFFNKLPDLRNDRAIVLEAVKRNGYMLRYVAEEFKADPEIVMEAVKNMGFPLRHAAEPLRSDPAIVMAAVKKKGTALSSAAEHLKSNREIVMAAVKSRGYALKSAAEFLRSDPEIVMAAVEENGAALQFASESLKADRMFMLEVSKISNWVLEYASEALKHDPTFLQEIELVKQGNQPLIFSNVVHDTANDFGMDRPPLSAPHLKS